MLNGIKLLLFLPMIVQLYGCREAAVDRASDVATAQQTYEWKLVTTWPKNFPGLGVAPERLAQLVDVMSQGRLKIKVYGAGELVKALGVFDAVQSNTAQMGHGAAYYWRGKIPEAPFFSAIPFGLTAQEMNGWLYHGGGLELWQKLYAEHNLYPVPGGNTGVQMAGWFNKEIKSIASLRGLKMRIPGLGGEVWKRAGGEAVVLPGGEIFTSMQTGVIDAAEWVGPYNDLAFGLHTIAQYYYYPGWHEPGSTLETIINLVAFQSLPKDLQAILQTACRKVNADMLDEFTAQNRLALKELTQTHGVELRRLPDDVLKQLYQASKEVLAELAQSSPDAKVIYQSLLDFRRDIMLYHQVTEQSYLRARDLVITE